MPQGRVRERHEAIAVFGDDASSSSEVDDLASKAIGFFGELFEVFAGWGIGK